MRISASGRLRRRRCHIRSIEVVAALMSCSLMVVMFSSPSPASASVGAFSGPASVAVSGTHVWVANYEGNSVTELNASNGSLLRVINATADGFNFPTSVAVSGTHVWVTNQYGSSVTELNASNGSLVSSGSLKRLAVKGGHFVCSY
jgi:DNA-binding beta-propeller fold protein YncE